MSTSTLEFVNRMRQSWDGGGPHPFDSGKRSALLSLSKLPETLEAVRWDALTHEQQLQLLQGCRRMMQLGSKLSGISTEGEFAAAWDAGARPLDQSDPPEDNQGP